MLRLILQQNQNKTLIPAHASWTPSSDWLARSGDWPITTLDTMLSHHMFTFHSIVTRQVQSTLDILIAGQSHHSYTSTNHWARIKSSFCKCKFRPITELDTTLSFITIEVNCSSFIRKFSLIFLLSAFTGLLFSSLLLALQIFSSCVDFLRCSK